MFHNKMVKFQAIGLGMIHFNLETNDIDKSLLNHKETDVTEDYPIITLKIKYHP